MAEKHVAIPASLAILPVRDTVLFPGAVLPLTVGRDSSLARNGELAERAGELERLVDRVLMA